MWITQSLSAYIEGFGCAELEEEVYADGKVVGVVGDVEPQHFLFFFLFFIVEEGEDKATVGYIVVGFELFFSFIYEDLLFHFLACRHREEDAVAWFVVCGVERARHVEYAQHVVVALCGGVGGVVYLTVAVKEFLFQTAFASAVGVPHFVDCISLAFQCSFAEIEGCERRGHIAYQCVFHRKD